MIDSILLADNDRPKKQRRTSKRVFERLRDEYCFSGKIAIVKDYISGWRQRTQEIFVPLIHLPGHAQADFGEALGVIGGFERNHFGGRSCCAEDRRRDEPQSHSEQCAVGCLAVSDHVR